MLDVTTTTTQLLDGLRDPGAADAWESFDGRYRPILTNFARRFGGLGNEAAAETAQEVLARFFSSYRQGRYDRSRGRLRTWLMGIARHVIADARADARRGPRGECAALEELPGAEEAERIWSDEHHAAVVSAAMERLRTGTRTSPRSIRAFEMVAIENRAPEEVAAMLDMTRHDVYVAKHRVTERLRRLVRIIDRSFDDDS